MSEGMRIHWGLVPGIEKLAADYDPRHFTLKLFAKGSTNLIAHGFEFVMDERFVGGLAFNAMCWVGPALGDSRDFEWSQIFNIGQGVVSLDSVLIRHAKKPHGEKVEVKWLGEKPPMPAIKATSDDVQPATEPIQIARPTVLNVVVGGTFEILADVKLEGVSIRFDPQCVVLEDAGIVDGKFLWRFLAVQSALTSIIVTYTNPKPVLGNQRIWDVNIGYPVRNETKALTSNGTNENAILNFLGGVNIATRIVQKQWPDAKLYSIDCQRPRGPVYPVDNAYGIRELTATFLVGNEGSVVIASEGWWSNWGPPRYRPGLILGNHTISWPPSPETWDISLEGAVERLLRHLDAPRTFWSCELWQPILNDGVIQPYYYFYMLDTSVWSVGAKDGEVRRVNGPVSSSANQGVFGTRRLTVSAP